MADIDPEEMATNLINQLGKCGTDPLQDEDLSRIAKIIMNPSLLAPYLGISNPEMENIKYNRALQEQKYELLVQWRRKYGNEATLSRLIPIFCENESVETAENICKLFERDQKQQQFPLLPQNLPSQQVPSSDQDPMNSAPFVNAKYMTEQKLQEEYDRKEIQGNDKVESKEELKIKIPQLEYFKTLIEVVNDIEFMTAICQMEGEIKRCQVYDDFTSSWGTYYYGKWGNVPVVVVQTGKQAGSQFQFGSWFETKKALYYMPQVKFVFGVGVCGAVVNVIGPNEVKPRVPLGHIVVSSSIKGYDHQRKAEHDQNRGFFSDCSQKPLLNLFKTTDYRNKWKKGLQFGWVLSGSWLVADIKAQQLVVDKSHENELAFEMEGVGIAAACENATKSKVEAWLVVKGVSDYANRDKDDVWQPAAARNATRFLSHMLNSLRVVQ